MSRHGQSLTMSPAPFLLHWVPSCGQCDGGAVLGELGWPCSAPWHGELASGLEVPGTLRGVMSKHGSRCLRTRRGTTRVCKQTSHRICLEANFDVLCNKLSINFLKVNADRESASRGRSILTAVSHHLDIAVSRNSVVTCSEFLLSISRQWFGKDRGGEPQSLLVDSDRLSM